jgi:hypothetical protein
MGEKNLVSKPFHPFLVPLLSSFKGKKRRPLPFCAFQMLLTANNASTSLRGAINKKNQRRNSGGDGYEIKMDNGPITTALYAPNLWRGKNDGSVGM